MSKKTGKKTDGELIIQAIRETNKELFEETGNLKPYAKRVIDNYVQNLTNKARFITGGKGDQDIVDNIILEYRAGADKLFKALTDSPEYTDKLYKKSYDKLKAKGEDEEAPGWGDLLSEIYTDEGYLNEIFVRLVEEQEGVEITSAKQLQDLTGIKKIDGKTQEATKQIKDTFIKAMDYRYCKTLENLLEAGASYKELLQIDPKDFHLPETWSGCLASDKNSSILRAIRRVFLIGEMSFFRPDLRTVAQEIEAPYSVLLEAHREAHKWN